MKKNFYCIALVALLISSCIKEKIVSLEQVGPESMNIVFSIPSDSSNGPKTKSESSELKDFNVTKLKANKTLDEELYLYESVQDLSLFPKGELHTRSTSTYNTISKVKVYGYRWPNNKSFVFKNEYKFIDALSINTPYNDNNYVYKTDKLWPNSSYKVRFFAVANENADTFTMPQNGKLGPITIESSVSSSQKDLIFASTDEIIPNATVLRNNPSTKLKFKHILSGIKFKLNDKKHVNTLYEGKIKKISLTNVHNKGTYDFSTGTWNVGSDKINLEFNNADILVKEGAANISSNAVFPPKQSGSDNDIIYVLPQTLSATQITIEYEINGHTFVLKANLSGKKWLPGHIHTYTISNSTLQTEETFDVTINGKRLNKRRPLNIAIISHEGGQEDLDIKITSRQKIYNLYNEQDQVERDLDWEVEFSTDAVNWVKKKPEWVKDLPYGIHKNEGIYDKISKISVEPQKETLSIQEYLRNNTPKGSKEEPYNLAYAYDLRYMSTANCYMINSPGWYMFPLVYGNSIEKGQNNKKSYESNVPPEGNLRWPSYWTTRFKNHNGNGIVDPWIKHNDIKVTKAELLWTDLEETSSDVITDIKIKDDYVIFKVPKNVISQSNSVIAAKDDNGAIVWSWHIWITPIDYYNNHKEYVTGEGISMFPLGYHDDTGNVSPKRDLYIRFTQSVTGDSRVADIVQKENVINKLEGRAVYYQAGRKDPFPIASKEASESVKIKGTQIEKVDHPLDVQNLIRYPCGFVIGNTLSDDLGYNAWNNKSDLYHYYSARYASYVIGTADKGNELNLDARDHMYIRFLYERPIKTVYDPSPAGFVVPSDGFLYENRNVFYTYNAGVGYIDRESGNYKYENNVTLPEDPHFQERAVRIEGTVWGGNIFKLDSRDWAGGTLFLIYNKNAGAAKGKSEKVVYKKYLTYGYSIQPIVDLDNVH